MIICFHVKSSPELNVLGSSDAGDVIRVDVKPERFYYKR